MRYTSFGRHFTKVEKLREVRSLLMFYFKQLVLILSKWPLPESHVPKRRNFKICCLLKTKLEENISTASEKGFLVSSKTISMTFGL